MIQRESLRRFADALLRALAPPSQRETAFLDLREKLTNVRRERGRLAAWLRCATELAALTLWRLRAPLGSLRALLAIGALPQTPGSRHPPSGLLRQLQRAARTLVRNRALSTSVVAVVALATATVWLAVAIVATALVRPLPYRDADRMVFVSSQLEGYAHAPLSGPELLDLRERAPELEAVAGIWPTSAALLGGDDDTAGSAAPRALRLGLVTANFLSTLGVDPQLGRWHAASEQGDGAQPTLVLSDALWRSRFGASKAVLGRVLRLDGGWGFAGGAFQVVGVAPPGLHLALPPDAGVPSRLDAWLTLPGSLATSPRSQYFLRVVGRLAPGATDAALASRLAWVGEQLVSEFPNYAILGRGFSARGLQVSAAAPIRPALLALLAGALLVAVIASANVANLLLVAAFDRRQESALRLALGASRAGVARLQLLETLMLTAAGSALGIGLAVAACRQLAAGAADRLPILATLHLGLPLTVLAAALALPLGLALGVLPAREWWRAASALGAVSGSRRLGAGAGNMHLRRVLLGAQVGLGVVLILGATLLVRTVLALGAVDPGFDRSSTFATEVNLPPNRYRSAERLSTLVRELEAQLTAVPGVSGAGAINQLPFAETPNWSTPYVVRGAPDALPDSSGDTATHEADARLISPGYFRAVDAHLLAGRFFDPSDAVGAEPVVIVDSLFARTSWPGLAPEQILDREVRIEVSRQGEGFVATWSRVVGVVEHQRHHDLRHQVREQVYVPLLQSPRPQLALVVRSTLPRERLEGGVRRAIAQVDPLLASGTLRSMASYVDGSTVTQRVAAAVTSFFSAVAVLLTVLGIHGMASYLVSQRQREIGVRVALGASRASVLRLVLGFATSPLVGGLVGGLALAMLASRYLAGLLFGVSAIDPAAWLSATLVVLAVAALACIAPALRALRTDPASTLHAE